MINIPNAGRVYRRLVATLTVVSIFAVTSAYAQTAAPKVFDVELVVQQGKKSVETDADITFNEESFVVVPDKQSFKSSTVEIPYKGITVADHSYSKKPMLSGGGAIATALLLSVFLAIPLLFIKKKKHWLTVQSEGKYAVIKLGDKNFRPIVAELESRGVKVNDLKEVDK